MQSSPASEDRERRAERLPASGGAAESQAPAPAAAEAALRAELARVEDRYRRALADLDNYRKRSARETERRVAEAREALLRDWLEALDSVERALRLTPEDEGLQAVLRQMEAILEREGVSRLGSAGERFDPQRHEAVGTRRADGVADHTIVEVARSGFALGERVLRPAQVVVARSREGEG